jgi:hypothetical protein
MDPSVSQASGMRPPAPRTTEQNEGLFLLRVFVTDFCDEGSRSEKIFISGGAGGAQLGPVSFVACAVDRPLECVSIGDVRRWQFGARPVSTIL